MTTYYVDNGGNDSNPGTSLGAAWKTTAPMNSFSISPGFSPGDDIIFTGGQVHQGPITLVNSGTAGAYISIGTGRGTVPTRIPASNQAFITALANNGANLRDVEFVWLDNLAFVGIGVDINTGVTSSTWTGISIKSSQPTNKLRANRITACTVTGTKNGLVAWTSADNTVGFDDLQLWGIDCHAVQWNGITAPINYNLDSPGGTGLGSKTQNSNVYIGHCQVYNSPGYTPDNLHGGGIFICNTTTATVEYCVVHDIQNGTGTGRGSGDENGSPGFEAVVCDGIIFQYNEAYNCRSNSINFDGEGFDIEPNSTNCILQYNYAHDNDGCGFLTGGQTTRFNVSANNNKNPSAITGNLGTINVNFWSINGELVHLGHDGVDAYFYGNTVYASNGGNGLLGTDLSGSTKTNIYNNIFVVQSTQNCVNTWIPVAIGNSYYTSGGIGVGFRVQSTSTIYGRLSDMHAAGYEKFSGVNYGTETDPLFLNAPASSAGILPANPVATLTNYDIHNTSPAINEAIDYLLLSINPGTVDFHNVNCFFRNAGAQQEELSTWHIAMARTR